MAPQLSDSDRSKLIGKFGGTISKKRNTIISDATIAKSETKARKDVIDEKRIAVKAKVKASGII